MLFLLILEMEHVHNTALRRQVVVDQLLLINKETLTQNIALLSEKDIFSSLSKLPFFSRVFLTYLFFFAPALLKWTVPFKK